MVQLLKKTMMVSHRLGGADADVGAVMALSNQTSEAIVVNVVDIELFLEAGVVTMALEVVTVALEVVTVASGEASEETEEIEDAVEEMEIGEEKVVVEAAVVVAFTKRHEVHLQLYHEIRVCRSGFFVKSARSLAVKVDTMANSRFYHPGYISLPFPS
jgi:hypothetical protein